MPKMIAYCGLVCSDCPTFLATQSNDDEARARTAAYYVEKFNFTVKPEDINCDGCLTVNGRLYEYCRNCKIRVCCKEKGIDSCALCGEQPCINLKKLHALSPDAKACFEKLLHGKSPT